MQQSWTNCSGQSLRTVTLPLCHHTILWPIQPTAWVSCDGAGFGLSHYKCPYMVQLWWNPHSLILWCSFQFIHFLKIRAWVEFQTLSQSLLQVCKICYHLSAIQRQREKAGFITVREESLYLNRSFVLNSHGRRDDIILDEGIWLTWRNSLENVFKKWEKDSLHINKKIYFLLFCKVKSHGSICY